MGGKTRVLIVDDDPEVLSQLRWALREEFDLLLAASPPEVEALLLEASPPAAALVDLHLPPETSSIDGGIAVIRALRRASAATRIVAISAYPSEDSDRRSRSAGASMLLSKPVRRARLLELLGG